MIVIVLLIIGICISFYFIYINNQIHEFWDIQPVSNYHTKNEGIILKPKYLHINIPPLNEYYWEYINDLSELLNFININYRNDENYTLDHLKYILDSPYSHIIKLKDYNRKSTNICLKDKNNKQIIGCIIAKPIVLNINNKIVEGFYVDFLCVKKELRNKRLAPILISKFLEVYKEFKMDFNIFKIDVKPLPFNYVGKFNYYHLKVSEILNKSKDFIQNIVKLDKDNIEIAYKYFYYKISSKYKLYQIMTIDEFKYYFIHNNLIHTYITFNRNNEINSFTSFTAMNYKDNIKTLELTYYLGNVRLQSFKELLKDYEYILFTDVMENKNILKEFNNCEKGHKFYYHFYNYHTNIKQSEIGIVL